MVRLVRIAAKILSVISSCLVANWALLPKMDFDNPEISSHLLFHDDLISQAHGMMA